jgi:hypothetical protein
MLIARAPACLPTIPATLPPLCTRRSQVARWNFVAGVGVWYPCMEW